MKKLTFVIIDDNYENGLKTKAVAESFHNLSCMAYSDNYEDGLDAILEFAPDIVFLEVDPENKDSNLSLNLINELYRYLSKIPKVFVTAKDDSLCISAFKHGVSNYFISPIQPKDLRKSIILIEKELAKVPQELSIAGNAHSTPKEISMAYAPTTSQKVAVETHSFQIEEPEISFPSRRIEEPEIHVKEEFLKDESADTEVLTAVESGLDSESQVLENVEPSAEETISESNPEQEKDKEVRFLQTENTIEKPLIICVKSYGDYRYIEAKDICYLQADNNSTDIHLNTGEMITAFKTLKHFENVLAYPFVRIHNSYIVNSDYVSRIHTGNAVCHIKNTTTKLPFSKSYKENVDAIINAIASGNYLEI